MSTVKLNHNEIKATMRQRKLESDINKIIIRKTTSVVDWACLVSSSVLAALTIVDNVCWYIYGYHWDSKIKRGVSTWYNIHRVKKFTGVVAAMVTAASWIIKPILKRLPTRPSEIILDPIDQYEVIY
ncbi:hypothetical protein E24_00365 [Faustovirus]|nr:hypothetical protein PRJ_Fausto_00343 [Faustovirus]AMN83281.1 hypothetical protein E24_00365 [Faustovirus]AMN84265.1 hypothetical protein D5a_00363 [Faustovirus]AMN85252.1 hypothetical protein E23_00365 [Faustovirus]QBR99250.1 hypothetical protein [Faustovirus mariensis]